MEKGMEMKYELVYHRINLKTGQVDFLRFKAVQADPFSEQGFPRTFALELVNRWNSNAQASYKFWI
jgi:hypothetical protein